MTLAHHLPTISNARHVIQGVHAIFAVTNFWEQLGRKTAREAAEYESGQAIKIASAAAKTLTLEHYVWSTLPATAQISKGKHFVPHSMLLIA